ncbi:hypothetical protein SAMN05216216_11069 [Lacicoccus qingdaonensis]|uniref:Uncharacterized protein n=2 Tax=Lacicoccus qingdaonensis TaxID=576118 RepID=A0A1G9F0C8_9BACL|nr:hypothetical protein SAMN05216216_11069 [Salinicoccus qingdaonensis]
MENAKNWINSVMPHSSLTAIDDDGRRHYKFKEFNIICKENKVITVSYYKDASRELADEIQEIVSKRVDKQLKPLKREYRTKAIKMHEAEIKRLKSYNPKSIETISGEIEQLKDEVSILKHKIDDFEALTHRFKHYGRLVE